MTWSDFHFINLEISGSSLEDGLESGEMGYRENSKLGARNKDCSELRGSTSLENELSQSCPFLAQMGLVAAGGAFLVFLGPITGRW